VTKKRYAVCFEQDESGAWIVWVPSVQGCHTQGRSLNQARSRIREALSLFVSDAWTAELDEHIKLPTAIRQAVRRGTVARDRAERAARDAQDTVAAVAYELVTAGYSFRDIATLLGLSHQRIAQILETRSRVSRRGA
jgi:predicted RNase H-like HicB family nuclease